jgi:hypothetical protein
MNNQVPLVYEIKAGTMLYRGTSEEFNYKNKNVLYLAESATTTDQYGTTREFKVNDPLRLVYMNDPLTVMYLLTAANDRERDAVKRSFPLSKNETTVARHSKVEDDIEVAKLACRLGYDGYYGAKFEDVHENKLELFNIPTDVTKMMKSLELLSFHSEVALCKDAVEKKIEKISSTGMSNQAPNSGSPLGTVARFPPSPNSNSNGPSPPGKMGGGRRRLFNSNMSPFKGGKLEF